jgi:RNA polymerase sigma factor (sigma-70 family)
MMEAVRVPPFERFYEEHQGVVLTQLRRMLGRQAAEDAFQETFLRALRAYPSLRHGRNLRAWALAIARNVAIDGLRKPRADGTVPELADEDRPAPHAELEHLTEELPPTERAAVVLRYGYDLSYADIAATLGSSEDAARQATSSGVRRLRKRRSE